MRRLADEARIRDFMGSLAATAGTDTTCYFTGGATAVLLGWRSSTIDVDIRLEPEHDDVMRALPMLKDAAPDQRGARVAPSTSSPFRRAGRIGACSYHATDT